MYLTINTTVKFAITLNLANSYRNVRVDLRSQAFKLLNARHLPSVFRWNLLISNKTPLSPIRCVQVKRLKSHLVV